MLFRQLFDPESATYTYLLADEETREAVLIDPVRDQLERDTRLLEELDLSLIHTVETHVHADHVTASGVLRQRLGSKSVLSNKAGAGCADVMVGDGDTIRFGKHELQVLETPGHTDGCLSFYEPEGGRVFTGDALLIRGCGRTDFQQGDPRKLYHSITDKLFTLPEKTAVYPGHDYQGRTASTVAEEKRYNPRLAGKSEDDFVQIMTELKLAAPKKLAEAVPANLACGMSVPMAAEPVTERGWAPIERAAGDIPELDVHWLARHSGEVRIVDVREANEYVGEMGHIEGAELVPMATLQRASQAFDREEPIVLVCRSGRRSGIAAKSLEALGFKRVASLSGGMTDWNEAGYPIISGIASAS